MEPEELSWLNISPPLGFISQSSPSASLFAACNTETENFFISSPWRNHRHEKIHSILEINEVLKTGQLIIYVKFGVSQEFKFTIVYTLDSFQFFFE